MAIMLKANPEQDTQSELSQGRNRDRDEFQQARDGEMKELVQAWRDKGSPAPLVNAETSATEPNPEAPFLRYTVDSGDRNAMKQVIRRAATLYKVTAVWYKDAARDDGTVTVKFSPGPLPPKGDATGNGDTAQAPATGDGEAPATDGETPATDAQDQETPQEQEQEASGRRGFRR